MYYVNMVIRLAPNKNNQKAVVEEQAVGHGHKLF